MTMEMEMEMTKPFILHVDDEPDDLRGWIDEVRSQSRVQIEVCHPDDVTEQNLRNASLVLVDFKIERWERRENAGVLALKPSNGLALLSVLQEAAYALDKERPRAFSLFTAVVKDVARGLVPQPHIVARAHNLEWVFSKTTPNVVIRAQRAAELAEAVRSLPRPWPGDSSRHASDALKKWLMIPPEVSWAEAAWDAVVRCRPPMHEFAEHTHGIGVLRWALHRVWPYPTFLLDDAHVAARLRVDLESLRTQLESNQKLSDLLAPVQYRGPLANFSGRRWWRAGLESIIFDLASSDPASTALFHSQLIEKAPGLKVFKSGLLFPVIDEVFNVKSSLAAADQVVEVVPDDWPPFADSAWALKSDLDVHAELAAVAVRDEDEDR
ncbi:hypothetical protein [Stigmatella erecta]|uniref:PH domain-containing protein n=1 Tax=Stigmatella erecta TaxID=83460 RepID=A0A1I0KK50_9BACT|nr:hypothetical protein [Stigmatella erecta]SEU24618.1 hypothetical protein SAMN05443639_11199 [Stigmatella erecta]